jgi:hypothetical protein
MKIYIGCALTHASEEFKKQINELKQKLKEIPSISVLEFLGSTDGNPRDVYVHDIINCVCECDLMIAICDYPSTGLGWEMATQVGRSGPLVAFARHDSIVSRLILDPGLPKYEFHRYHTIDDIFNIVVQKIQ